ncbi:MAG: hypothetical protein ACE5HX_20170, partial [bacterium]
ILVAAETDRTDNLAGQMLAIQIQKKYPEFLIKIINYPNLNITPLKITKARFKIIPFLKWQEHLRRLARFYLVINMDVIWTLGRLAADCAAVGTPIIGLNANNQLELFPRLAVCDVEEIGKAKELAQKLIFDENFYRNIQIEAQNNIAANDYSKSKARLKKIIETYSQKYALRIQSR